MEAKNISISVPAGCPNKCPFCVAEQHDNTYENKIGCRKPEEGEDSRDFERAGYEYQRRLDFATKQGVASALITGTGEPLMNMDFIVNFAKMNKSLHKPFDWIELQTSGVKLSDTYDKFYGTTYLEFLRDSVGVSTIALSVCDIFSSRNNAKIMGISEKSYYNLDELCHAIKDAGMNLRLSLNMTDIYNNVQVEEIFKMAECLGADQLTFRKMFHSGDGGKEDTWIKDHLYSKWDELTNYIEEVGTPLHRLSFGPMKYSVNGISTVADWDCMSTTGNETATIRSLILRPNCKLYTHWGDKGSLIF
jgi:MoaA/NifB/PqqE/SkfB family radical SAM enzyme